MRIGALRTGILLSFVVGVLAGSAWGQQAPKPAPDEGLQLRAPISCVVKITCDPTLLPLNPESIRALLRSSYVAREALKQALETPFPGIDDEGWQVDFKPLAGGAMGNPSGPAAIMGMMGGVGGQPPQGGGAFVQRLQGGGMSIGGFGGGMSGGPGPRPSGQPDEVGNDSSAEPPGGPGAPETRLPGAPDHRSVLGAATGREDNKPASSGRSRPSLPRRGGQDADEPGSSPPGGGASASGVPMPGMAPPQPGGFRTWNLPVPPPAGPGLGRPGSEGMFNVMVPASQESSLFGEIQVWIQDTPPSRNEAFLKAVCDRLQQALNDLWEKEMTSVNRQVQMSQDEQARAEAKLRDLQKQRRALLESGHGDLTPEVVMDQMRRLDLERQRLEMDLIGQQVRLKALQQQIKDTGERILKGSGDNAVVKPVQEKLDQLRKQLDLMEQQYKAGLTPESEVQKVRIALSEGEIQLAEVRRKVAQAGGGEVLGKLNTELTMLSVTVAETEARLKYVSEQMDKAGQLAGPADEYELGVAMTMPYARRACEMSRFRVEELQQRMRGAVAPTVTVIGGATSKPAK
jgi:hypothetical protein